MKLLTKQLEARFKEVGDQAEEEDPIIIAKFLNPNGSGTWYAISYEPEHNICFGYVTGLGFDELGSFSIVELESLKPPPLKLPIERDIHFDECRLSDIESGKVY
jgi:hypothetical protein